jgi:hypothetical protein
MKNFVVEMSLEERDALSCDEVFCLYLRHASKQVNESYYRTILRFVLLYRECLNECGWFKRREHFQKAFQEELEEGQEDSTMLPPEVDDFDELLSRLKREEMSEEELREGA